MLPDEILLAIFDFCGNENDITGELEAWETLVHVCRRWRSVVFGSPRRLNLQLVCSSGTPAKDMLDVWPALPLVLLCDSAYPIDNIVAVLEHSNRVRQIELLEVSNSCLEKTLAATQVPFPELTDLVLMSYEETARVLPDSFLGGSAPSLRRLVEWRPISGITETASVGRSPRRSYPLENSSFRILFTRGHAHCPLHADQPPISLA
jgi:hypothetical protein